MNKGLGRASDTFLFNCGVTKNSLTNFSTLERGVTHV